MKRKRSINDQTRPATIEGFRECVDDAIARKDSVLLANQILSLCGMDHRENPPSKVFAELLAQAAHHVSEAATMGIIQKLEANDKDYAHRTPYFYRARVPIDCIGLIASYLETDEKMQLASLNKSWKMLSTSHYFWQICDPFPVKAFANHAEARGYLNRNKQKFLSCLSLQMPRVPTSMKLFQDVFKAMPLLKSISLYNVIGTATLKHCISSAPNSSRLIQLTVGLSTRVSPLEITSALKSLVNLRAFSLAFWQDFRVDDMGSFSMLGTSISNLKHLQYLSLRQSVLYPENYLPEDDEMTDAVFETLASNSKELKDVYLGSFHAVTSLTWQSFATHCHNLRSFSMEDCGLIITDHDIRILTDMAHGSLRYLTLFPRALVDEPSLLPGPEEHYITPEALEAILVCRETHPQLTIFLKSEYADAAMSMNTEYITPQTTAAPLADNQSAGVAVNHSAEGMRDYNKLVSLGHIAAFRMYDYNHLLPISYFEEEGAIW